MCSSCLDWDTYPFVRHAVWLRVSLVLLAVAHGRSCARGHSELCRARCGASIGSAQLVKRSTDCAFSTCAAQSSFRAHSSGMSLVAQKDARIMSGPDEVTLHKGEEAIRFARRKQDSDTIGGSPPLVVGFWIAKCPSIRDLLVSLDKTRALVKKCKRPDDESSLAAYTRR